MEHDRRADEGWRLHELIRPSDRLDLDAIGFTVDLETIHLGVPALHPVEPPDGDGPS